MENDGSHSKVPQTASNRHQQVFYAMRGLCFRHPPERQSDFNRLSY
jgi:hypothetical protein